MSTTTEAPAATRSKYEPVIGLEVHVQLLTKTKIFCGCSTHFGDPPNTNVCPVCLGLPGALPVLNRRAVEFAVLAATALNCQIRETSIFARKNYFYPDLPKGYQISQYDKPLAEHGYIEIDSANGPQAHRHHARAPGRRRGQEPARWTSRQRRVDLDRPEPLRRAADRDRQRARHLLARRSLRVPDAAEGDHPVHRRQRLQHGRRLAALRRQRQHSSARAERVRHQDGGEERQLVPLHSRRRWSTRSSATSRYWNPAARSCRRRGCTTPTRARPTACARRNRRTIIATSPSLTCCPWWSMRSGARRLPRACLNCRRRGARAWSRNTASRSTTRRR